MADVERPERPAGVLAFLDVDGEMPRLILDHDWSGSLGPIESWPAPLCTTVGLMIRSPIPMVLLWGEDGIMIYNDAYSEFAGGRHPELLGARVREGWSEVADFNDNVMKVGLAGGVLAYRDQELTLYRTGRPEQVWMNLDYSPVVDESGRPAGVIAIVVETTARVRSEAALREREARLSFMDRISRATASLSDSQSILGSITRMVAEHFGASICAYADMDPDQVGFTIRGDWAAQDAASIVGHYELPAFGRMATANLSRGLPLVVSDNEVEMDPEEARSFQAIGIAATICIPLVKDGRLTALMAVHDSRPRQWSDEEVSLLREVTERCWAHVERVAAEAELRSSEARYRTLFEAIDAGFCIIEMVYDPDGRPADYVFIEANPAFERQAGFEVHHGRRMREIVPEHEDYWFELYGAVAETGRSVKVESGSAALDRWWEVTAFRVGDPGQNRVAVLFNDVSERHRAELALRELNDTLERRVAEALAERRLLADIVDGADAFVQVADREYRWLAVNRSAAAEFEHLFGVRPRVGDSMLELLSHRPRDLAAVRAVWSRAMSGEAYTETAAFGDEGRSYEMTFSPLRDPEGEVIGAYQFVYDVTERVREQQRLALAEEQLRQSQKMEAMGQLTGGVAHDFNNLLTPIVGSLDMLHRKGVGGEREQRLLAGAIQSAERAQVLVQRLLAFARRQPLHAVAVDMAKLVEGMADLVSSTTGPQIRVVVEAAPDLPAAKADPNQVEMALLNLAVNARDAMPEGGILRITASAEAVGPGHPTQLPSGDYVRLSVADTGAGMDEATLARAVEPFFSTKGLGKGTGLGLSMVHGLTLQLGGALTLHSRPGLGTHVELWLPVSHEAVAETWTGAGVPAPAAERGLALLVDDEELVRLSTSEMLKELGYRVVEAASAEEALGVLRDGLKPTLLVTDHLMPGIPGTELARAARTDDPDLMVLVVSGYADLEGIDPDLPRLTKPFRSSELASALASLA